MIKFDLPKELDDKEVEEFLKDKTKDTKTILKKDKNFIKLRIKQYQRFKKYFHVIQQRNKDKCLHDALLLCFSSKTKRFKDYLDNVQEKAPDEYKNRCPYCGINDVNTVDHILPKHFFSEYSFLPINLIYVCSICNELKGDKYRNKKERLFINPYIDDFLDIEFFKIILKVDKKEPYINYSFDFDYTKISDDKIKKTIENHFSKLNLMDRIRIRINTNINRNYVRVVSQFREGNSVKEIKKVFIDEEMIDRKLLGVNHFQTAIDRAFGNSDYVDKLYEFLKNIKKL